MAYRLRSRSAKQREYQQKKFAAAMEGWRSRTQLHEALDSIERDFTEDERLSARAAISYAARDHR